jgi:hypothetical protein
MPTSLPRTTDDHAQPIPRLDPTRYGVRPASPAPSRSEGCECSTRDMRVVGYLRESRAPGLACVQPLRAVCRSCDGVEPWACNCSSARKCPPCAEKKRRQLERIVDHGIVDRVGKGYTYLLTLTAPGDSPHRRWVQGSQRGQRPECSCWDTGVSMGAWNARESSCWNRLRLSLDRVTDGSLTYIGAVEPQKRGALHRHVVINVDRRLLPVEVQALALAAGYGCVLDLAEAKSARSVARYISKYVTKSASDRPDVPWERENVDHDTGELTTATEPTYRSWSAARSWGFTIKGLRDIARVQAAARARHLLELQGQGLTAVSGSDGTAIDSLHPPPT